MPSIKKDCLPIVNPITNIVEPEACRLARTIASLGNVDFLNPKSWCISLSRSEINKGAKAVSSIPHPFIAIHAGYHSDIKKSKDWGYYNWADLLKKLRKQKNNYGLLIVGGKSDQQRAKSLLKIWGAGGISLCGKFTPRETAAAIFHSSLFCGHDSGPMHLAHSVGVKILGIFGDFNKPNEWHPIGNNVNIIQDLQGIKNIKVEKVFQRIISLIE